MIDNNEVTKRNRGKTYFNSEFQTIIICGLSFLFVGILLENRCAMMSYFSLQIIICLFIEYYY